MVVYLVNDEFPVHQARVVGSVRIVNGMVSRTPMAAFRPHDPVVDQHAGVVRRSVAP